MQKAAVGKSTVQTALDQANMALKNSSELIILLCIRHRSVSSAFITSPNFLPLAL